MRFEVETSKDLKEYFKTSAQSKIVFIYNDFLGVIALKWQNPGLNNVKEKHWLPRQFKTDSENSRRLIPSSCFPVGILDGEGIIVIIKLFGISDILHVHNFIVIGDIEDIQNQAWFHSFEKSGLIFDM